MDRSELLKEMISEYRRKIETYQAMISEWEKELGVPAASLSTSQSHHERKPGVDVQPWQFLGKSQPEAAKALLSSVGHPMTTEEIIEGIKRGGVEIGSKKYTFYTTLSRTDGIARFRKNTWGLSDWAGAQKQKVSASKTKVAKKAASKKPLSMKKKVKPSIADLAEEVMRGQMGIGKAGEILKTLNERGHAVSQAVLASALKRGVKSGRFARLDPGVYTVTS
jgi:hypothetical protein